MSRSKAVISQRKNGREVQLDLHGYSTETALWLSREVVETAWERGCDRVVMIHGSKHVATPAASSQTGQGRTKWSLRQALSRGGVQPLGRASEIRWPRPEGRQRPAWPGPEIESEARSGLTLAGATRARIRSGAPSGLTRPNTA